MKYKKRTNNSLDGKLNYYLNYLLQLIKYMNVKLAERRKL